MKLNTQTPSTQEQSSSSDVILSQERAKELEKLYNETQLPKGFFFVNNKLKYLPQNGEGQNLPSPIDICSRLDVTACTRDDNNQNHGRLLEFKDIDGHHHVWAMPMELLAGDGKGYRQELLSMGLNIEPGSKARNLLSIYIQSCEPATRARCVTQTGWYKSCFVFPEATIGTCNDEKIILQTLSSQIADYSVSGDLCDWQRIAAYCRGNSRLTFSMSCSFASPLLFILGIENGGFHFRGSSSAGKTTALAVANSVWGGKEGMQKWRATINGIEGMAIGHNDALLCLDEISQVDASVAGEIAYMLANGSAKTRLNRSCYVRKKDSWRLIFLSSGGISLADHMNEAGKKVKAGQEVRLIDVPAETTYGIFENLHGYSDGAVFSDVLMELTSKFYGVAAREYLIKLIAHKDRVAPLLHNSIKDFIDANVPKDSDGQVIRVAKRFGLVAAAGELATAFEITGWENGEATIAAKACFDDWLRSRGSNQSQEEIAILNQARRFFEQHGESRFTLWGASEEQKTINRAGFRKSSENGTEYFVFPEVFKTDIAAGFDYRLVGKVCLKHGLLRPGTNGAPTRSEKLPCLGSCRCYRFTEKVLGEFHD